MVTRRPSDRAFGLVFAGVFGAIALIVWLVSGRLLLWAVEISAGLLIASLLVPGSLMPLNRLWTQLGHRLGIVTNYLLLGAFFYLVIVPFGLALRLFRRSSISKRPDPAADSHWTPVGRRATSESYADMF